MHRYRSTKTYGHDAGFSCAFRQWKAPSHCKYLHGYALSVHVEFEALVLDERNWVVDFGSLGVFKKHLVDLFDHKTVVASDDPRLEWFRQGAGAGLLELTIVDAVGCEAFAELIFELAKSFLIGQGLADRVFIAKVEVREHGGNSAMVLKA